MLTRRRLLVAGAAAGLTLGGGGTAAYAGLVEREALQVTRHTLDVANLPERWVGRTIAHLTDVHVGPYVSDAYLARVFAAVAALSPDVVAVTGDLTSMEPGIVEHAARVYATLPPGRLATLAVLGNHDYGERWNDAPHADALADAVAGAGLRVLRNEAVDVDGLALFGADDLWAGRLGLASATQDITASTPAIGLTHNPDALDLPGWGEFSGWVLAGHTHGGQVNAPLVGPPVVPVLNRAYTAGACRAPGGRRVYVSRGIGTGRVAMRLACAPELALHTLARA